MKQLPDRAQLRVTAGQRRFQPVHPLRSPDTRQHPGRPPQPVRLGLPFQRMLPGVGEPYRAARQPLRRPVGQHLPRVGGRLYPGRGVHRVPGHHPLTGCTQRDGDLAGHHPGPRRQARRPGPGSQLADRSHQVQPGTDRPLRVPLGRRRRAPHGHHSIPDELLHRPAVPADHRPCHREVAGQQLPHRFGVAGLRQRGEPGHVAEQHRAHPPLRHRPSSRPFRACCRPIRVLR
jgi:hypothetical protein